MKQRGLGRSKVEAPPVLTHERGVIIPIMAVMSLAVIATLVILGFETSRAKQAATLLRGHTERICKNVARSAMLPQDALATFSREINLLPKIEPFTRITSAKLVLPLPLDTSGQPSGLNGIFYNFSNTRANTCNNSGAKAFDPRPTLPLALPFAQVASSFRCVNPAAAPNLTDCTLVHDICDRTQIPVLPNQSYPPSMWSDIENAGNTVGCELTAEVDNVLNLSSSATRQISAKAAWWVPVRTRAPYLENFGLSPTSVGSFVGLSLGIATQMTTWPGAFGATALGDNRFNFSAYGSVLEPLNPRRTLLSGQNPQRLNFAGGTFESTSRSSYPPSFGLTAPINLPPAPQLLMDNSESRAREEYLTACVNPLILVRNIIAGTIVELAARHGQLRNRTQITSINPRHEGDLSWEAAMNRPAEIVAFGQDLTNEAYQHPFVTSYVDGAVPGLGTTHSGFLLPWAGANGLSRYVLSGNPTVRLKRDTFLAQQLRYCFHLWDTDLIARPRLPVHGDPSLPSLLPVEYGFLPSLQNPSGMGGASDPTFYRTWDYGRPWGDSVGESRLLNGAEVVQSLGSSQLCPVTADAAGVFTCKNISFDPATDLEPDLKAFLDHQLGSLSAYPSPGLFHPTTTSNGEIGTENDLNPSSPMYRGSNTVPVPPRSVVVIVTTKGLFHAPGTGYHNDIVSRVQTLNTNGRPVIVVFIPATGGDSNTVSNYCTALRRGADCSTPASGADNNRLFLLSPYSSEYGGAYTGATEGETFINFWEDLLLVGAGAQDLYAGSVGRAIFSEAIVGLGPKL